MWISIKMVSDHHFFCVRIHIGCPFFKALGHLLSDVCWTINIIKYKTIYSTKIARFKLVALNQYVYFGGGVMVSVLDICLFL